MMERTETSEWGAARRTEAGCVMAKFRKKPTVIEAVQFDDIPAHDPPGVWRRPEDNSPYVVTIHDQRCYIEAGVWIIPEPDGVHYYPCKPDIFAATYEPVEESL